MDWHEMTTERGLGFIGLGVMGEPMCRHLAVKSGRAVVAYDLSREPLERLKEHKVQAAASAADVIGSSEIVFLSLPSGKHLKSLLEGPAGLLAMVTAGQTIVDLGTSPLQLTRSLSEAFARRGAHFVDAPVARTRKAAEEGTLALMVGGTQEDFDRIHPYVKTFASEVTYCGESGSGQIVKILNNMVVVQTVMALSEAAAIASQAGMPTDRLFSAFSKASADSFALRNHGLNAVAPGTFPQRVFSTSYMLKDVEYALQMAADGDVAPRVAQIAKGLLDQAIEEGHGDDYWPVISTLIARS
jgi:3-hydroxyisobutyrate dehydrogenase-like beta-hydroxyacid dehydrogenase